MTWYRNELKADFEALEELKKNNKFRDRIWKAYISGVGKADNEARE